MKLSQSQILFFQKKIFHWWKTHKRDLPWRHTHDPYSIMVSEIMLQQTQVPRVLEKYKEFLASFSDVYMLASASPADVLKIWKGMGYNRRALYLHKTAKEIVAKYKGKFPKTEKELIQFPGLGTYTARAILVFAFKKNIAMVDTNIRQIIVHFFFENQPQKASAIQEVADQLVPKGKSWEWHQALMDYGALEGKRKKIKGKSDEKKQKPFKESNRFYRGRIIDRLREGSVLQSDLIQEFIRHYGKSEDFTISMLHDLERDGLLVCSKDDVLKLPE